MLSLVSFGVNYTLYMHFMRSQPFSFAMNFVILHAEIRNTEVLERVIDCFRVKSRKYD